MTEPRGKRRTITVGRLVLTTCIQSPGAPLADPARVVSPDGWSAGAWCIRLGPSEPKQATAVIRAVVVGWKGARRPHPRGHRRRLKAHRSNPTTRADDNGEFRP